MPGESTVHDQEDQTGKDPGTIREAWDHPGHEADAYRASRIGTPGNGEGFDEITAAETPETTRHLSDARITPKSPKPAPRDLPETIEENVSVLGAPNDRTAKKQGN
jgi:hypothetical protein